MASTEAIVQIEEALDRFLLQLEANGRSPHTQVQYRRHIRLLAQWTVDAGMSGRVEDVGHEILAGFLASPAVRERRGGGKKKATSLNALRTSLRSFFAYLADAGFLDRNPARLIRRVRCTTAPPRALSEDEEGRLLAVLDAAQSAADRRDRVMFRLMLATGIRIGSALALAVDDVDLERRELRLRHMKGNGEHVVLLPSSFVPLLREYVYKVMRGPLFRGRGDLPLAARHVNRRLQGWAEKAGITRSISPHTLRHTTATRLYERTGDLLLVQRALGHRSIGSTAVYARMSDARLRAAVEASGAPTSPA